MFNYAFIVNSENLSPKEYSGEYNNKEFSFYIAATSNLQMAKDLAKNLAKECFDLIDLCGDFDASDANKIASVSGIEVCYAKYMPEEIGKLKTTSDLSEYGVIVMGDDIQDEVVKIDLESDEFNTRVRIVGSDEDAKKAAVELVDGGISFIELCSYFDVKKTNDIIKAIDGKVPVGYCG